jgi:hypothetical protein
MPAFQDLTGQRFGRLLVLVRAENGNRKQTRWLCRCDCGIEKVVPALSLKQGGSRSCGCLKAETSRAVKYRDLAGTTYGRLTVIKEVDSHDSNARWLCRCSCGAETVKTTETLKSGHTRSCGCIRQRGPRFELQPGQTFERWTVLAQDEDGDYLCRCSCGLTRTVSGRALKGGKSRSCGCLASDINREQRTHDLVGRTFHRLTVVARAEVDRKDRRVSWLCRCTCGNEIVVPSARLVISDTKSCGCLKRETVVENGQRNLHDVTGQLFGTWLVMERVPKEKGNTRWLCRCIECDSERDISVDVLTNDRAGRCQCRKHRDRFDRLVSEHLRSLGFGPTGSHEPTH